MKKFNGDVVGSFNLGDKKNPSVAIYRSELHKVLHEYASSLGIPIEFSTSTIDYFENEDHGGVELADSCKLTADIVVAADGVGSKSWRKNCPNKLGICVVQSHLLCCTCT